MFKFSSFTFFLQLTAVEEFWLKKSEKVNDDTFILCCPIEETSLNRPNFIEKH